MRNSLRAICLFLCAALLAGPGLAASPELIGCDDTREDPAAVAKPLTPGPLELAKIHCLDFPHHMSESALSPDGQALLAFDDHDDLWLSGLHPGSVPAHFSETQATSSQVSSPFAWSNDVSAAFGVRRKTTKPNGFASGPLEPFLFSIDRKEEPLPAPTNAAGPLDELYWAGSAGMAVAAFGTQGRYYRPEHPDPHPTIAIVDARAGKVVQSVEIASVLGLPVTSTIVAVSARIDGRGLVHTLISFSSDLWVDWIQGEQPHMVPIHARVWHTTFALSPDGRRVLIMKNLSATGVICERDPQCPPPISSTGPIAELHEISTGRVLWSLDGTAETFSNDDNPAISPDGRYALVSIPRSKLPARTALVSMASGQILQQIPKPSTSECTTGFLPDGKTIWISGDDRLVLYHMKT